MKTRWPWFAVWVPVGLLLYTLVNGAGHVQVAYVVTNNGWGQSSQECGFVLRVADFPCGPWGSLIIPVLVIFAYASWKLCPQWSPTVRRMAGWLGLWLSLSFLLAQAVLLCPKGWRAGVPSATELRVCAVQLWKPHLHLCRPISEPFTQGYPGGGFATPPPAWEALASDFAAFLQDRNADVRSSAAWAMGLLGEKSEAPRIAKLLRDADRGVRWSAINALARIDDKSIVPQVARFLEEAEPSQRAAVLRLLGGLGDKSVVPQIVKFLDDADPETRQDAAYAFCELADKSAAPRLAKLLEDPDFPTRCAAARALGQLGEKSVIPRLIKLLESGTPYLRLQVAIALWKLGDKSGVSQITKLLEKADPEVSPPAATDIRELSGETWPDDELEDKARAWWAQHRNDPEWKAKR